MPIKDSEPLPKDSGEYKSRISQFIDTFKPGIPRKHIVGTRTHPAYRAIGENESRMIMTTEVPLEASEYFARRGQLQPNADWDGDAIGITIPSLNLKETKILKATESWCFQLAALYNSGKIFLPGDTDGILGNPKDAIDSLVGSQIFIVQNDWAEGLKETLSAGDFEYRLPFPKMVFEFKVDNGFVIAFAHQNDDEPFKLGVFAIYPENESGPFGLYQAVDINEPDDWKFIVDQIKAITVALDTEIADREDVKFWKIQGRETISQSNRSKVSFHLLKLSKKYESKQRNVVRLNKRVIRLHFRRGHYRICASGLKVWVKWHMVGYQELGFSDKFYLI